MIKEVRQTSGARTATSWLSTDETIERREYGLIKSGRLSTVPRPQRSERGRGLGEG